MQKSVRKITPVTQRLLLQNTHILPGMRAMRAANEIFMCISRGYGPDGRKGPRSRPDTREITRSIHHQEPLITGFKHNQVVMLSILVHIVSQPWTCTTCT